MFKAKLVAGIGTITPQTKDTIIFTFPISKEQTENTPGTIKWVRLKISKQSGESFSSLIIDESTESPYNPGAPDYAEKLTSNGITQANFTISRYILNDIVKVKLSTLSDNKNSVDIAFKLVCPNDKNLKKEIKLTLNLNVEITKD